MGLTVVIYKSLIFFSIAAGIVIISSYISYKIKNKRKSRRTNQAQRFTHEIPQPAFAKEPSAYSKVQQNNQPNYFEERRSSIVQPEHRREIEQEGPIHREPRRRKRRIPKERVRVLVPETFSNEKMNVASSAISIEARKYLDMIQFYSDD